MRNLILGLILVMLIPVVTLSQSTDVESKPVQIQKSKVAKTALVFVQKADSTWEPRMVEVGLSDFDYTEIISGLKEGERVAMLSAAILQAQRVAAQERLSKAVSGTSPLGGSAPVRP